MANYCSHPQLFTRIERITVCYTFAVNIGRYDPGRLNSALELVVDETKFAAKIAEYQTSIVPKRCNCSDHMFRQNTCKHMIAIMLEGCVFA